MNNRCCKCDKKNAEYFFVYKISGIINMDGEMVLPIDEVDDPSNLMPICTKCLTKKLRKALKKAGVDPDQEIEVD